MMKNPIWDIDDGDFMFRTSDNMAIDSDGHMMMQCQTIWQWIWIAEISISRHHGAEIKMMKKTIN